MPDMMTAAPMHDAHNHLQDPLLDDARDEFLANRASKNIGLLVVNGTSEADWSAVRALADADSGIIPAFGVHPWFVDTLSASWKSRLASFLDSGGCIGEIGLDRWRTVENFDRQREVFLWQWGEALRRGLAATVHCLRAWGPLMEIIREAPHHNPGFLLHAYGGPVEMVDAWVELGAYFSFSASFLADGRARKLEPFRVIPSDRLLVETDAPFMPPPASLLGLAPTLMPDGAAIHHPSAIVVAYEGLAKIRSVSVDGLRDRSDENFIRLFGTRPQ